MCIFKVIKEVFVKKIFSCDFSMLLEVINKLFVSISSYYLELNAIRYGSPFKVKQRIKRR